jgi:hypothetical protein
VVHTGENCADMFTQPVLLEKLRWCLDSLGLQEKVMIDSLGKGIKKLLSRWRLLGCDNTYPCSYVFLRFGFPFLKKTLLFCRIPFLRLV